MAEILLRVIGHVGDDPWHDAKCTKAGDVIVIQEDGWTWGTQELAVPFWRIVRFPGIPAVNLAHLISKEREIDPRNPSRMLRQRGFMIDLRHPRLPPAFQFALSDRNRIVPIHEIKMTEAEIGQFVMKKDRLLDPSIIGRSTTSIFGAA